MMCPKPEKKSMSTAMKRDGADANGLWIEARDLLHLLDQVLDAERALHKGKHVAVIQVEALLHVRALEQGGVRRHEFEEDAGRMVAVGQRFRVPPHFDDRVLLALDDGRVIYLSRVVVKVDRAVVVAIAFAVMIVGRGNLLEAREARFVGNNALMLAFDQHRHVLDHRELEPRRVLVTQEILLCRLGEV